MSTPSTSLPTRQQLDEIDALLQRMLSLPGEPAEPPPAPAVTYPAVREVAPPREPAPGEPAVREWRVDWIAPAAPAAPSVVAWGSPVPAASAADLLPRFDPAPAPVYAVPVPAELPFAAPVANVAGQPPTSSLKPPVALPVRVLMMVNGTFNLLTYLLGPLGTWLRGPGRNALGWCGFVMVLAAAGWAVGEWYGIDWPKPDLTRFGWPPTGQ
jgi:hypothetical protein